MLPLVSRVQLRDSLLLPDMLGKMTRDKSSFPKENEDQSFVWLQENRMPWSLFVHQRVIKGASNA